MRPAEAPVQPAAPDVIATDPAARWEEACSAGPANLAAVELVRADADGGDAERGELCCRICLLGPEDGGEPLSLLRCSCRGSLRLVHPACADAWFASKGSAVCEVCRSGPAWTVSLAALREAAAKRAAERATAQRSPEHLRLRAVRLADAVHEARVRALFGNLSLLLALGLTVAASGICRRVDSRPSLFTLLLAFVAALAISASFRPRLAPVLRPLAMPRNVLLLFLTSMAASVTYVYFALYEPYTSHRPNFLCLTTSASSCGSGAS